MNIILERFPYRYVEDGVIELNGKPDYRIQKFNEDAEYTKWLDPAGVPCYVKDEARHYE